MPGDSPPRPLATRLDTSGLHARFLVRPGSVVAAQHSSDLSDWSGPSDSFTMPLTTNLLRIPTAIHAPRKTIRA